MKKIDVEVENEIIKLYCEGKAMRMIGEILNLSITTIFNVLKRNNVQTRTRGGIYSLDEKLIIKQYQDGISSQEIANKYNVCCHTITNILEKNNIKRNNLYYNKSLIENYWKDIDTYDKAYFLGFLLTDGNVIGNCIRLQLSEKDKDILEVFREKTCNENPLAYDAKRKLVAFHAKRKQWVTDLDKHAVYPNKTYTAHMPSTIPDEMMPHFLRGCIDGDGWICSSYPRIGFCGNKELVESVHDYLVRRLNVYDTAILHRKKHLWSTSWSSKKDLEKIGHFLYDNKQDCYLSRKFENFLKIVNANAEVKTEIT